MADNSTPIKSKADIEAERAAANQPTGPQGVRDTGNQIPSSGAPLNEAQNARADALASQPVKPDQARGAEQIKAAQESKEPSPTSLKAMEITPKSSQEAHQQIQDMKNQTPEQVADQHKEVLQQASSSQDSVAREQLEKSLSAAKGSPVVLSEAGATASEADIVDAAAVRKVAELSGTVVPDAATIRDRQADTLARVEKAAPELAQKARVDSMAAVLSDTRTQLEALQSPENRGFLPQRDDVELRTASAERSDSDGNDQTEKRASHDSSSDGSTGTGASEQL